MWENLQLDPKSHCPGTKAMELHESCTHKILPCVSARKPKIHYTCMPDTQAQALHSLQDKHTYQGSPEQPGAVP